MKMWPIVNVGILALIVAGCASSPLIPQSARELASITADAKQAEALKPLAALSCSPGQRIVIVASPVESPYMAAIANRSWLDFLPSVPSPIPIGHYNVLLITSPKSSPKDLTTEFKKDIEEMLGSVDLQQLLLLQAELVIKSRRSCETTFLPTTLEKPAAYSSSDKVVVIMFYFSFMGHLASPPSILGVLSTTVMTGENATELTKHADEAKKIMEEMKELEPYIRVTSKIPDTGKLKQCVELGKKLAAGLNPYIEGTGTVTYESPTHTTNEWLANDGAVAKQEIAATMNRLIGDMARILFK